MKSSNGIVSRKPFPEPNWEAVERRLHQERKTAWPGIDTDAAIAEFKLAFQTALSANPIPRTTGLIEQQACFTKLGKPARKQLQDAGSG